MHESYRLTPLWGLVLSHMEAQQAKVLADSSHAWQVVESALPVGMQY